MNDVIEALGGAVSEACARHETDPDASAVLNASLWEALDQIGVLGLGVDEEKGGAGGGLEEVVAVLQILGANSAAVPFAETGLAAWVLGEAGVEIPEGRLTVATADELVVSGAADSATVTATLRGVAWADAAEYVVVVSEGTLAVVPRAACTVTPGVNTAGEPRDTVVLDGAQPLGGQVWPTPAGLVTALSQRLTVLRLAQMAGAARRCVDLSVTYASERQQFGRSLDKFQSVQHQLAALASEALFCKIAAESAATALERGTNTEFALSAAKAAAAQASGVVARLAHQVHGAIGFTEEHTLRLSTTRLWAWRDENGTAREHAARVGKLVLEGGADELWQTLVRG